MKNDHEKCLHVRIPDSVYAPLAEKLEKLKDGEKIGNKMFQLSIKTIVGELIVYKKIGSREGRR